jgi:hypothetical protein
MTRHPEISADNLGFGFALAFEGFDHFSGKPGLVARDHRREQAA